MENRISLRIYSLMCMIVSLLWIPYPTCYAGEVAWHSLVFEGNGLFASIRSGIYIMPGNTSLTGHFTKYQLPMSNFLPDEPVRRNLLILHASTAIKGMFIPDIEYERTIWFRPETLQAVCRLRWNMNRPETVKLYKWDADAVTRWKLRYHDADGSINPVGTATYRFGSLAQKCSIISEPALLLYLVSFPETKVKSNYDICVFGKKMLHHLSITRKPFVKGDLDGSIYDKQCVMEEENRNAATPCPEPDTVYRIIELAESKCTNEVQREKFSLLGLQGEITILVAGSSKLPVQIDGHNEYAGRVILKLNRAVIK